MGEGIFAELQVRSPASCQLLTASEDTEPDATIGTVTRSTIPDSLRAAGFGDGAISDLQGLFEEFNGSAIETVIPALPVYAVTLDASGRRAFR